MALSLSLALYPIRIYAVCFSSFSFCFFKNMVVYVLLFWVALQVQRARVATAASRSPACGSAVGRGRKEENEEELVEE